MHQILRVALPRTPTPVNVSPPRRIGPDFRSTQQPPLQRCRWGYPAVRACLSPILAGPCGQALLLGLPCKVRMDAACFTSVLVHSSEQWIELEVPPEAGNGAENAGLPLACLLWHLPARPLVALVEALLLERRVLMVAQVCI